MIRTRADLKRYLAEDWKARFPKGARKTSPQYWAQRPLWQFNRWLRLAEYHTNNAGALHKALCLYCRMRLTRLSLRLGWLVPLNACGEGLCVVHHGSVAINRGAHIGRNARIHVCVSVGTAGGRAPTIGDDCYIGPGARLYGPIVIGDRATIGANAVVNRSFPEPDLLLVGVPATARKRGKAVTE